MVEVKVHNKNPTEIMDIVRALREQGYIQGKDFDFAYHQSKWDEMIGDIPTYTVFKFYQDKYATLFALKYIS